jgi:hypothetical protein
MQGAMDILRRQKSRWKRPSPFSRFGLACDDARAPLAAALRAGLEQARAAASALSTHWVQYVR